MFCFDSELKKRIEMMTDVDDKKYSSTPLKGDSKEKESDNEGIRLQPKMSLVYNQLEFAISYFNLETMIHSICLA